MAEDDQDENSIPEFSDEQLLPTGFSETFTKGAEPSPSADAEEEDGLEGLRNDIQELTKGINRMLKIFEKAHDDIVSEPEQNLNAKLDRLLEQNANLAKAMYSMLEITKEHLPKIVKQTRISKRLKRSSRRTSIS